ncbi:hypothetical protein SDJN03_01633, partial [Cucurbita argyrosperma subsp. sororia]
MDNTGDKRRRRAVEYPFLVKGHINLPSNSPSASRATTSMSLFVTSLSVYCRHAPNPKRSPQCPRRLLPRRLRLRLSKREDDDHNRSHSEMERLGSEKRDQSKVLVNTFEALEQDVVRGMDKFIWCPLDPWFRRLFSTVRTLPMPPFGG